MLQIKISKYARALKEGGVKIFMFLSGKLLHFFFLACVTIEKKIQQFFWQFVRSGMPFNRKFLSSMWSEQVN